MFLGCALHWLVSSVLQGQLPSIISCKNTVSCYFYFISFPGIFLSCFQSITPASLALSKVTTWDFHKFSCQALLKTCGYTTLTSIWLILTPFVLDEQTAAATAEDAKLQHKWWLHQWNGIMVMWGNAPKGGTQSLWWAGVPPAQPWNLLLLGTAWAIYSQAAPEHCWLLLCSQQISVLSFHWNTGSFHGFLSTSQYSLFLPLSIEKLVFPPSSETAKFWLLCNPTFGNFHTPALLWSNNTYFPNLFFFLSKQVNLSTNSFYKSPSYSVWPLLFLSVISSWILNGQPVLSHFSNSLPVPVRSQESPQELQHSWILSDAAVLLYTSSAFSLPPLLFRFILLLFLLCFYPQLYFQQINQAQQYDKAVPSAVN